MSIKKIAVAVLALWSWIFSLGTFFYFAGWIANRFVSVTVDAARNGPVLTGGIINFLLLSVFCLFHSGAARLRFKAWSERYIPQALDRAVYNLASSILLLGVCFYWYSRPELIWAASGSTALIVMDGLNAAAWILMFAGIFLIDHNEFFGLRQAWFFVRGESYRPLPAVSDRRYALSRVPLMLGLLLIPWTTRTMSIGQLYFAAAMTVYCVVGSWLSRADWQAHQRGA